MAGRDSGLTNDQTVEVAILSPGLQIGNTLALSGTTTVEPGPVWLWIELLTNRRTRFSARSSTIPIPISGFRPV
jgi:hypothetical protein